MKKLKEVKKVLILGLGAIGSIYATKFYDFNPDCVKVLLDKSRYDRYKKNGIIFNNRRYDFDYVLDSQTDFKADLIIVATKSTDFEQASEMIRNFVGENTIILSLLNGISSEEVLIEKYGKEKVLYSYFLGHASMRKGFEIKFDGIGDIFFGGINNKPSPLEGEGVFQHEVRVLEKLGEGSYSSIQAVKNLFDKSGITYKIPEDMLSAIWQKFVLNIGVNQTLTMLKKPYKTFKESEEARNTAYELMSEAVEIAKVLKIKNCDKFIDNAFDFMESVPPELKPSMLQDIENGNQTEIEIFAGEVYRLGKRYNIATPKNELAYNMIKDLTCIQQL